MLCSKRPNATRSRSRRSSEKQQCMVRTDLPRHGNGRADERFGAWLQPTVPPFTIGRMNRILRFAAGTCLLLLVAHGDPLFSQTTPERVWLAGRYDRTRVVVYFEAVKFDGTFP